MPEVIGSTYEIIQRLGSGGGGVVYLANHLRLNKQVVLKADKRQVTTRPELLRREVDVLKDLSHPYIPQVYDFFVEGETVYTAMDFVDGESLDKSLKRGDRFSQPEIIKWAKQLLEALQYLHSPTHGIPPHGYVHSDIKPANIMRRMNGDICLIDFNISLALGEENIIGASAGYASPEHYGLDFSFRSGTATQDDATLPIDDGTVTLTMVKRKSATTQKVVVPDVRSDIYSLGATLYHLLSGKRPAKNATEVVPLSETETSGQICAIIAKAMNPNPDCRYQTAEEMLWDFEHLHERDPRSRKLKRLKYISATVLSTLCLLGCVSTFSGLRLMEREQQAARAEAEQAAAAEQAARAEAEQAAVAEQEAKEALELIQTSQNALSAGDKISAKANALAALEKQTQYDSVAQRALTQALGVYDLSDGFKTDCAITLPGGVMKQSFSPSGRFAAVLTSGLVHVLELDSGIIIAELPANNSAYSDMVFAEDETLVYAGADAVCAYDIKNDRELWNTGERAVGIAVSQDGMTVAAAHLNGDGAEIYDVQTGEHKSSIAFGNLRQKVQTNGIFADPLDDIFALDAYGRYLAVSFENGGVRVFDTIDQDGDIELLDESDYVFFEGGFFGTKFGFVAYDGANSDFYVIDTAAMEMVGSLSISGEMRLAVCEDGFCLAERDVLVLLDIETGEQTELAYTQSGIQAFSHTKEYTLVQTADQKLLFFDSNAILFDRHDDIPCDFAGVAGKHALLSGRDLPSLRLLRMESFEGQQMFSYDGTYIHDEARVNSDRSTVMLFQVDGFRIYNPDGELIAEVSIPDPSKIYDQQYRRENGGDKLEIIYYDGLRRVYSAADGSLLSETAGEKPDDTLYEEYLTDRLRITSPLHGTPMVFDRGSGELLKELESEDYLAYVTPIEGGLITEYISSKGERYGLLLDGQCDVIADLPNLCDILPDGTLVFDDMRGNLRKSRIYSIQELIALGDKQ